MFVFCLYYAKLCCYVINHFSSDAYLKISDCYQTLELYLKNTVRKESTILSLLFDKHIPTHEYTCNFDLHLHFSIILSNYNLVGYDIHHACVCT